MHSTYQNFVSPFAPSYPPTTRLPLSLSRSFVLFLLHARACKPQAFIFFCIKAKGNLKPAPEVPLLEVLAAITRARASVSEPSVSIRKWKVARSIALRH